MNSQLMLSLEQGEEENKKRLSDPLIRNIKNLGKKTGKSQKMRVKLPNIDSYEKELEYPCEAPGRVVVRLERLVGTDKVRITDRRYMNNLLKKLEEEEIEVWTKRNQERRKEEKERSRKLAIDGKMEPGPEMGDLYKHPVFRVNRIIARLEKMDATMVLSGPVQKPPPILPVEPFDEYKRTGILFGFHKDHFMKVKKQLSKSRLTASRSKSFTTVPTFNYNPPMFDSDGKVIKQTDLSDEMQVIEKPRPVPNVSFAVFENSPDSTKIDEMDETNNKPPPELPAEQSKISLAKEDPSRGSVSEIIQLIHKRGTMLDNTIYKEKYQKDLERQWKVRRSHLIDLLYKSDEIDPDGLYGYSKQILDTYRREQLLMDNFITKEYRKFF